MSSNTRPRVAIVTGAAGTLGAAMCARFVRDGVAVVVADMALEPATDLARRLAADGGRALPIAVDVTDYASVESMVTSTLEWAGRLDILVNNAGWTTVVPHQDLDALTDEIFEKTFQVNVFGTWWLTKAAMPHLRESPDPNVVMITSVAGVRPVGSSIAYSMTKAALNHLTELLAKSCSPVRINAVAPGLVATPWTADWDAQHAAVSALAPLGRSATPADCAEAVVSLVRNPYVTGHILVVDGGMSLVM